MIKFGDSGEQVTSLQQALLSLGYALPRWGADGSFGAETADAANRCLLAHSKIADDDKKTVNNKEYDFIVGLANKQVQLPAFVVDVRNFSTKDKIIRRRAYQDTTGVVLHQTACLLGENPDRWAGRGKWQGRSSVGAHLGTTRGGKAIWLYDFDLAVVHGNGFNRNTIGIEMDGHYCGVKGNMKTYWRPKDDPNRMPLTPTQALIDTTIATVKWVCTEVRAHGGRITHLYAHRQSSDTRRNDPGSELWQAVALPLIKDLKLSDGGWGYKIGDGYPIPEVWDASKTGIKY